MLLYQNRNLWLPQVRKVEKIYKELLLNSVEQAKIRLSIVATQADAVSLSKSDKRWQSNRENIHSSSYTPRCLRTIEPDQVGLTNP